MIADPVVALLFTYRRLLLLALDQLHEAHGRQRSLEARNEALRGELRRYTAAMVKEEPSQP